MAEDEVTCWIAGLSDNDPLAAQRLWDRYYERLVRLAHRKLGDANRRISDEEDVALSAFHSFCQGAAAGRFPRLDDREDLWRLLVTITARKASAHIKREHRQKRGGGLVQGESAFLPRGDVASDAGIDQVVGHEPTPALAAQVAEQFQHLLDCLGDESLRRIAIYKLQGYTNEEIAGEIDCALRTVKRRLAQIRDVWQHEAQR